MIQALEQSRILYEDNHLIVVNKRSGEIVQGDKTGDETLGDAIKAMIKERDNKPGNVYLGVVHRLDRPTSGAIIFAKTSKALSRMNAHFRDSSIKKSYWAVLCSSPKKNSATLTNYLYRDTKRNISSVAKTQREGLKKAILSYKVLEKEGSYTLVEVDLQTGRHHQIRAQFKGIACSIKGDLKYGAPEANGNGGIHLHARTISFPHPTKDERLNVTASCPREDALWQALEQKVASHQ